MSDSKTNIFDPEFQRSSSSKPAKKEPKPKGIPLETRRKNLMQDEEIREILDRIDTIKKDLKERVAVLIEKHGYTPSSIKKYLNDPKNFTPEQWITIQKQKEEIAKTVGVAIDPLMRKQKKLMDKKQDDRSKNKSIGARKRWMPMQ